MPEFNFDGFHIEITENPDPDLVRLQINGTDIPLFYDPNFLGWGVDHTIYGIYDELEILAKHFVICNPNLFIGHGGHEHGGNHQ